MLCEKCQKNTATVHMQQFINGKKKELRLCQECIFKLDNAEINPETLMSMENILKGFLEQMHTKFFNGETSFGPNIKLSRAAPAPCTRCGMTYDEFKSGGKLGCDTCYQSFSAEVSALLKNVQGSTRHEGKYPRRLGAELRHKRRSDELRASLKKAVEEENYEEAARIRDEIRAMEVAQ